MADWGSNYISGVGYDVHITSLAKTYPSYPGTPSTMSLDAKGAGDAAKSTSLDVKGPPGDKPSVMTLDAKGAGSGPTTTTLQTTGVHRRSHDPYGDFNFIIEIDGLQAGAFQKCDGISYECDVIEYRESTDPWPRKRRGQVKYGNIKLTKGYTTSTALWDWCMEVMDGGMGRRTGAIHLLADDGSSPIVTYRWIEGWPSRWNGFRLDGKSSSTHLVEEIEFVIEKLMKD